MKDVKELLNEEHGGFAITLEVMLTLAAITLFLMLNVYILAAMNAMRYTNTIATGAASMASRWGGNNSYSYQANVSADYTVAQTFQVLLDDVPLIESPSITVTPDTVNDSDDTITVNLTYTLSNGLRSVKVGQADLKSGIQKNIQISVKSIMQPGGLLR